jgi:GT2 family glycosyltransferase
MHSVLVVTVNYRVGPLCVQSLESIAEQIADRPGCRVVVVDNASHDGSAELIEATIRGRGWQSWATLVRSPVNGGFAAGNNVAIRPALAGPNPPDYVHLLNPDTIVRPGAIEALWNFMESHKAVGIAGSRLENVDGTQQHSRFRFPSLWSEIDAVLRLGMVSRLLHKHVITPPLAPVTEQVDWLAGASMMIRREVLDQIGLLDEEYFMYFEETDFSLQARKAGWTCWYLNESRVVHLVGRSSSVDLSRNAARRLPPYWYRSRRRYWVKNHGFLFALFLDAVALSCDSLYRLRRFLQRRPTLRPQNWASDLLRVGFSRGARGPLPPPPQAG